MDRLRRHELKQDKFVTEVGSTVQYVTEHKRQVTIYAIAGVLVVVLALGGYWWWRGQQIERQQALADALEVHQAVVGPQAPPGIKSYPTDEAKNSAAKQAFAQVAQKYSGSDEGAIARYYQGVLAAHDGETVQATEHFQAVIDSAGDNYASLARLALADVFQAEGRLDEAEKLLRPLLDHPTVFVSKEQAALELADVLATTKPAEARKLLEPLRTDRSAVSRAALSKLAELPPQ